MGLPYRVHERREGVRPRSQAATVSRQGPTRIVPLTLTTMATLEPSDADVADTADTAPAPAEPGAEDSVLSRPYRAPWKLT